MIQKVTRNPGRRRKSETSLSKEEIIDAAIKILDRDGTTAFSMRNLAAELKVYPTAIYWHVENRNALIGEVIAQILTDLLPDDFEVDWKDGIVRLCRNYRVKIKNHPNIAPLIGGQLVSNASLDFTMIERILSALENAGFKGSSLRDAYNTVISAMVGYTTQEFALVPSDASDKWSQSMKNTIRDVDPQQFPTTARNLDTLENQSFIMRWENGTRSPMDDGFELYIRSIVEGLALQLRE